MARPIALRNLTPLTVPTAKFEGDEPQLQVEAKTLWSPPQGLDYLNRKNRIDEAHAAEMLNVLLDIGVKRSRNGTQLLGAVAAEPVMGIVQFVTGSGIGFILRFTTARLQRWNALTSLWVDVQTGFTGGTSDYWAYTAYNNTLLFSNGVNGLWEYAPMTGTVQQLTQGPSCKHLTVVGGRVVASACNGQEFTTMWSVKNNSHDWTGIGSGTEDLLSTPGGQVDSVLGVFPITDDTSLMARTNSIWMVTETGDPEAPFNFRRLHHKLGSRSRHSIDVVPGGIVMVGNDDIYLVGVDQPVPIGTLIKSKLAGVDLTKAQGRYRSRLKQYWVTLGGDEVFVYSFLDKGWSRLKYPFDVRWLEESIFYYGGTTWDEQATTWDAAVGTWEGSLGTAQSAGFFMATAEALGNSIQEVTTSADAYIQTGKVAQGIELQTKEFNPQTPLDTVQVNETQMEYEAGEAQDLQFFWSQDGGTTWNLYSEKSVAITTTVEILRATKQIERPKLMLRMVSPTLGKLTLVSLSPFLVIGAKREP